MICQSDSMPNGRLSARPMIVKWKNQREEPMAEFKKLLIVFLALAPISSWAAFSFSEEGQMIKPFKVKGMEVSEFAEAYSKLMGTRIVPGGGGWKEIRGKI